MGNLCGSSLTDEQRQALEQSRKIDQQNGLEFKKETEKMRMLLLGAGESGKSTIFKQMRLLYGDGFDNETKLEWKESIHQNTMNVMKSIVQAIEELEIDKETPIVNKEAYELVKDLPPEHELTSRDFTPELVEAIKLLWNEEEAVKQAWERRSEYPVVESNLKYITDIDRSAEQDYLPTEADILLSRVRTTGIVEESYTIDDYQYIIIDVGGQRNERKKWMHCFDSVKAVIFVAALSEYDQKLYEDETCNRMVEAINLFADQCNNQYFKNVDIILFLNKRDLFEDKIKLKAIESIEEFEDYDGAPNDYDDGCEYFLKKFKSMNKNPTKDIYHHVTCATDSENVRVIINACMTIVLKKTLQETGFMD